MRSTRQTSRPRPESRHSGWVRFFGPASRRGGTRREKPRPGNGRFRRAHFEPLEDRRLLSIGSPLPQGQEFDWGDAPDSDLVVGYPTLAFHNGACRLIGGPWLGDDLGYPDSEGDGQPNADATGDDTSFRDDEQGVQIPALIRGMPAEITFQVGGGGGVLDAWIDWNGNNIWEEPAERIAGGTFYEEGTYTIPIISPEEAPFRTFGRFRISQQGGDRKSVV